MGHIAYTQAISAMLRQFRRTATIRIVGALALALVGLFAASAGASAANCPTYKGFYAGNCTCYAAQEFDKIAPAPKLDWTGNAGQWYANAAGWARSTNYTAPQTGAIIVWTNSYGGHVAIVDSLGVSLGPSGSKIVSVRLRSMNSMNRGDNGTVGGFDKVTTETVSLSRLRTLYGTFQGYIYPKRSADLNGSGAVDNTDLSILLANFGKHATKTTAYGTERLLGDINGDHTVDIIDLSILLSRWNTRGW